jgi:hypothetical protein
MALEKGSTGALAATQETVKGPHAEVIVVPKNLRARIPDRVSDEAAFTRVDAISLLGIRLAEPNNVHLPWISGKPWMGTSREAAVFPKSSST